MSDNVREYELFYLTEKKGFFPPRGGFFFLKKKSRAVPPFFFQINGLMAIRLRAENLY